MKTKIFLLIAIVSTMFVGCDDEVLEKTPQDAISDNAAFETADRIELSMNGVYDAAQSGFYRGSEINNRGYIFGAAHIQQADMRGEDMLLINTFYDFTYRATYNPTTENNRYFYENGYRVINLANSFIEGVTGASEAGIITAEEEQQYIGEARFLRALTLQEMLFHFARPYRDGNGSSLGMPFFTQAVTSGGVVDELAGIGRSTVAENYAAIIEDLDFAEANLPASRETAELTTVRATSGAAIALKTRTYLHMADYANVIAEGNKIVSAGAPFSGGGYQLTADPYEPFATETTSENIFSMAMSVNDALNVNSALAIMYGSSANPFNARGEVAISPILWNETFWHPDDLRRSSLFVASGASGRLFTKKYSEYINGNDFSPVLRYAEVLLNVAEAEARTGNTARGSALLNAVRDRNITGTMTSYGTINDQFTLIGRILEERRIEYLAEGQRWKDIHRNAVDPVFSVDGIPAKLLSSQVDGSTYVVGGSTPTPAVPAIPYDNFRFLWPFPASVTTINETLRDQQNPGY